MTWLQHCLACGVSQVEEGKTAQGMLKAEIASLKMDVDMDTRKLADVAKTVHTLERDRNVEQEKRRRETEKLAAEAEKVDEADRSIKHLEQKINRCVEEQQTRV